LSGEPESLAYYLRNVNLVLFGLLGQLHQEGQERSVFFEGLRLRAW